MRNDKYPQGTLSTLLDTSLVTYETREVLKERLVRKEIRKPSFFDNETFTTLRAVCKRLIPQPDRGRGQLM